LSIASISLLIFSSSALLLSALFELFIGFLLPLVFT
jgi:hypothetical protein